MLQQTRHRSNCVCNPDLKLHRSHPLTPPIACALKATHHPTLAIFFSRRQSDLPPISVPLATLRTCSRLAKQRSYVVVLARLVPRLVCLVPPAPPLPRRPKPPAPYPVSRSGCRRRPSSGKPSLRRCCPGGGQMPPQLSTPTRRTLRVRPGRARLARQPVVGTHPERRLTVTKRGASFLSAHRGVMLIRASC